MFLMLIQLFILLFHKIIPTIAAAVETNSPPHEPQQTSQQQQQLQQQQQQNFIFYIPDEMSAESLGCYGNIVSKTPNFDNFATNEAVRFDQAYVSNTVCTQSRVSFMTGWPTHVAGHRSLWNLLHEYEPNLLKYFKAANYTVMWWGKNDLLAYDSWNTSVTQASQSSGGNDGSNPYPQDDPRYYTFLHTPRNQSIEETMDYQNVAKAIKFLESKKSTKPFFLFLPLTKPHPPYSCPEPFYSSISPSTIPPLRPYTDLTNKPDYYDLIRTYRNLTTLDDKFWKQLHAVYLGSVSYSDYLFGLLLDAVEKNGHRDSTTIALFSDHGDYAGHYGLVEKWPSGLEDVLTRVPLIIRCPNCKSGHVIKELVQLYDVVPTMLEIANISATHVQFGQSLVPQLMGGNGNPHRAVFVEGGYSTNEPRDFEGAGGDKDHGGSPMPKPGDMYYPKSLQQQQHPLSVCRSVSIRTSHFKLVLRSDPTDIDHYSELYDLSNDPLELHNLYNDPTYNQIQIDLKQQLLFWYIQTSDVTPWNIDPRNGGYPWPPPPQSSQSKFTTEYYHIK